MGVVQHFQRVRWWWWEVVVQFAGEWVDVNPTVDNLLTFPAVECSPASTLCLCLGFPKKVVLCKLTSEEAVVWNAREEVAATVGELASGEAA